MQATEEAETPTEVSGLPTEAPVAVTLESVQDELKAAQEKLGNYEKQLAEQGKALSRRGADRIEALTSVVKRLEVKVDALVDGTLPAEEEEYKPPLSPRQQYHQAVRSRLSASAEAMTPEQEKLLEVAAEHSINLDDPEDGDAKAVLKAMTHWGAGRPQDAIAALEAAGKAKQSRSAEVARASEAARMQRQKEATGVRTNISPSRGGSRRTFTVAEIRDMPDGEYQKLEPEIRAAQAEGRIK